MFAHVRRIKLFNLVVAFIIFAFGWLMVLPAQAAACTWTGATNSDWATAGNWADCEGRVPDSGDTALIPALSNQPLIGQANEVTINGLLLNEGAILNVDGTLNLQGAVAEDGDLTIRSGGTLNWSRGTMSGHGTTTIEEGATLVISGRSTKILNGRALLNAGMVLFQGTGGLDLYGSAVITNHGIFEMQNDEPLWSTASSASFHNHGTLLKSAGEEVSEFDLMLHNTGLVRVESGTLRLDGGGTSYGTFETIAEATIDFGGGTFTLADYAFLSGNIVLSRGTLNAKMVTIAGDFTNNGGTFDGTSGTVTFSGGLSQRVAFNSSSTFNDVIVSAGTTLLETGSRNQVTINGALTNNGLIRSTLPIEVTGQHQLGLTGAKIYVDTLGSLVSLEAEHVGNDHPNADDKTDTGQYWHLEPNGSAYVVDIMLPHRQIDTSSTEICALTPSQTWECRQDAADIESVTWADFTWSASNALEDADWVIATTSNASQATIEPNAAGVLSSEDSRLIIQIPPDSVNQATDFGLTRLKAPTHSAPSGLAFAGEAFDLRAFRNGQALPGFSFQHAIDMRVYYDDAQINGVQQPALELYYWNGKAWTTTFLGDAEINAGLNRLEVTTANTGEFALFGSIDCVAMMGVNLVGPLQGITGVKYNVSAVITPTAATLPINYHWTPEPLAGQGSPQATFLWNEVGSFAPSVSVSNCRGNAAAKGSTTISAPPAAGTADAYEADDNCAQAGTILTNSSDQKHNFHQVGDIDWISFSAHIGTTVIIEALTSPTSNADVVLELFDECGGSSLATQNHSFSDDVRLIYQLPSSGTYYLRLSNHEPNLYGDDYRYELSIQAAEAPRQGALVLVAGKLKENDPLQENIHHLTNALYDFALQNGCTADDIYYLATDASLPGVDDDITPETLDYAITEWAPERLDDTLAKRFTLYAANHGAPDTFYLNGSSLTMNPKQLDGWLDELDIQVPNVASNIIIEAPYSGSFIAPSQQISQTQRLVIASTGADKLAYATKEGAFFSDKLLDSLTQGQSLKNAFQASLWRAQQAHPAQTPWLDADGDGIPNEPEDSTLALRHTFACAALPNTDNWAPNISQVQAQELSDGNLRLSVIVQDDKDSVGQGVEEVWATIYSPGYSPPSQSNELVQEEQYLEHPPVIMRATNANHLYEALLPSAALDERGTYRIVIHALDKEGTMAQPQVIDFHDIELYLPLLLTP